MQFVQQPPVNALSQIANVTEDGGKAFFQTADPLVLGDTDDKVDVYEWEAEGKGGCELAAGCVHLISGGHSAGNDYLYAMTPDGSDVFFESGDTLLRQDPDATPSIYDAREGGGFPQPPPPPAECLGEACQPSVTAPSDPTPAIFDFGGPAINPRPAPCRKGKHAVRRHGKRRCVGGHRRHHKAHHKHRRARAKRRASR